jgi:hypothetical protein
MIHINALSGAGALARCATRLQTERLRSAESYVPADDTSAASSPLRGARLSRNRQLGLARKVQISDYFCDQGHT